MSSACKLRAGRHQPADVVLNGRRHSATNPQPARTATVEAHGRLRNVGVVKLILQCKFDRGGCKKMEEDIKDGPYECFDA